ncbi:MAG: FAD:protein FMN transferase [Pirellulales bacterium]
MNESNHFSSAKIGQWQDCSTTLWSVLEASDRWYQLSEGKLDPAIGNLTRLWRKARRLKKHPSQDEIEMALGKMWMEVDGTRPAVVSRLVRAAKACDWISEPSPKVGSSRRLSSTYKRMDILSPWFVREVICAWRSTSRS